MVARGSEGLGGLEEGYGKGAGALGRELGVGLGTEGLGLARRTRPGWVDASWDRDLRGAHPSIVSCCSQFGAEE